MVVATWNHDWEWLILTLSYCVTYLVGRHGLRRRLFSEMPVLRLSPDTISHLVLRTIL